MIKNITFKRILATVFSVVILLGGVGSVLAQTSDTLKGLNATANCSYKGGETNCKTTRVETNLSGGTTDDASLVIGKIIGIALSFLGLIFFVLMIYGGFLWMTARGEGGQVTKAKDLIEAATIGLIIILSAYAVTAWLGGQLTT